MSLAIILAILIYLISFLLYILYLLMFFILKSIQQFSSLIFSKIYKILTIFLPIMFSQSWPLGLPYALLYSYAKPLTWKCIFIPLNFILFKMVNIVVQVYVLCLLLRLITQDPSKITFSVVPFLMPSKRVFLFYQCSHNAFQSFFLIVIITLYLMICSFVYSSIIYFHLSLYTLVLQQYKCFIRVCFDCASEHYSVFQ